MSIITNKQLSTIRKKHRRKKIVFASGTFDLTHANHVGFLEHAKKQGDYLVVSVGADFDIKKNKGSSRPILNEAIRLKMVDSLKPVDYSFLGKRMLKNQNSQARMIEVFRTLKPDIYYVDSDASELEYRQQVCKQFGVTVLIAAPYKKYNLSTTKIIEKILKAGKLKN